MSADRDYRPGHARMFQLLDGLALRRPRLRIRIAGTNGKGSTAFMLAAALQSAGLRVGLYTSPHILSFNERIRINGAPVADRALLDSLAQIMPLAHAAGASYFETATALALEQFSRAGVDVEILEAGVGARLDATTAVDADMALITPIGLDHESWLGDTIQAVASEKTYAMQGCGHCFSAPQVDAVAAVLRDFEPAVRFCAVSDGAWRDLAMRGAHQRINAALAGAAAEACRACWPELDVEAARDAIRRCVVPGRLQYLRAGRASIWLDAAHNRHAVEVLLPSLKQLADPFDAILAFTREDRSLADALPLLAPYAARLISNDDGGDGAPATVLRALLREQPDGRFLVLGSFMTVAAILRAQGGAQECCADGANA